MNFQKINQKLEKLFKDIISYPTVLVGRGKLSSTLYLKIPLKLRKGIRPNKKVMVKRITKLNKILFIFEVRR